MYQSEKAVESPSQHCMEAQKKRVPMNDTLKVMYANVGKIRSWKFSFFKRTFVCMQQFLLIFQKKSLETL